MIDFACKKFIIDDVIKCSFGLSKSDLRIFYFLMGSPKEFFIASDISKKLKLDLSTVQRSLKKLYEKDVLVRRQNNLDTGGYIFIYQIKDRDEISSMILEMIDSWKQRVEKELAKL